MSVSMLWDKIKDYYSQVHVFDTFGQGQYKPFCVKYQTFF